MKAFAAFLAIALCSSGVLVQGGALPGLGDVVDGVGGVVDGVVNVPLQLVKSVVDSLINVLSNTLKLLPNIDVNANVGLENLKVGIGALQLQVLEDNNLLDARVDNVTILISNFDIDADIAITNLTVPGVLENASITDKISIQVIQIQITLTVDVSLGLKPVISDIINIGVNVQAAVAVAANINSDLLNLALGADLPLTVSLTIGKQLEENKEALIALINSKYL